MHDLHEIRSIVLFYRITSCMADWRLILQIWIDWFITYVSAQKWMLKTLVHSQIKVWGQPKFRRGLLYIQCESKNPPWGLVAIFPKRLGIFQPNFTCLLRIPVYARLRICFQISASLTKLCHIKRDHPVKIICAKCPPSTKTHFLTFFPNSLEFLV